MDSRHNLAAALPRPVDRLGVVYEEGEKSSMTLLAQLTGLMMVLLTLMGKNGGTSLGEKIKSFVLRMLILP